MPLPSFFLAGNSKSGTTALHAFLKAHPDLYLSDPKEPNYFATDFCRDPNPTGAFHPRSAAEYVALFDAALPHQHCGESSACYLYSGVAAKAIHAFNPKAKIIFILREPVDFLYSYHRQLLKNPVTEGETVTDLAQAMALEPERRAGRHLPPGCLLPEFLYYRERIRYTDQLARYYDCFDAAQIKVILYDDFKANNARIYQEVLAFIGVDPTFTPPFSVHNEGQRLRSKRMQRLMHHLMHDTGWLSPITRMMKRVVPLAYRRRLLRTFRKKLVYAPKAPVGEAQRDALKWLCTPEVVRLSAFLGLDLRHRWGYEEMSHMALESQEPG